MAVNKVHWWDAPKGFKAVLSKSPKCPCRGCAFYKDYVPFHVCFICDCTSGQRKDKQDVIFVKRDNNNKK